MPINRVVAVATAVISLALAVVPVVTNMDWQSTAGIIAGILAVLGVANRWLIGWQQHEALSGPAPVTPRQNVPS